MTTLPTSRPPASIRCSVVDRATPRWSRRATRSRTPSCPRASTPARTELGPTRRLVAARGGQRRRVRRHLPGGPGRRSPRAAGRAGRRRSSRRARRALPPRRRADGRVRSRERRPGSAHDLHPDLALLLSTSGSTGSPKLVRLSRANVVANARSIADYLGISRQRPRHHLAAAPLLLRPVGAEQPPASPAPVSCSPTCRWPTSASGPWRPRAGRPASPACRTPSSCSTPRASAARDLPDLAVRHPGRRPDGSRAHPCVRRARPRARLGPVRHVRPDRGDGPDGLPAARPRARPPGGRSASRSPAGASGSAGVDDQPVHVGELVYRGPNVMMGYAESPADLARGAELTELRTGDLARQADDGLWELVGRLGRHAKLFGLRLDLDRVESVLHDQGLPARVAPARRAPLGVHRPAPCR